MPGLILIVLLVSCASTSYGQTSYGQQYFFAFPPVRESVDPPPNPAERCWIQFVSGTETQVRIRYGSVTRTEIVTPAVGLRVNDIPCTVRVQGGFEATKTFNVSSDFPVGVVLTNIDANGNSMAVQPYPLDAVEDAALYEHYIVGFTNELAGGASRVACGPQANTAAFVIISASEDDTTVQIYGSGNYTTPLETIVLQGLDTFTMKTLVATIDTAPGDYSGYFITSDKKVFISSGSLCTDATHLQTEFESYSWLSVPPVTAYGTGMHIPYDLRTFRDGQQYENYYAVAVLSPEDDNEIQIGDLDTVTLNRGEIDTREYLTDFFPYVCSKPCYMVQFSVNTNNEAGIFGANIPAVSNYGSLSTFYPGRPRAIALVRVVTPNNQTVAEGQIVLVNVVEAIGWQCFNKPIVGDVCQYLGVIEDDSTQTAIRSIDTSVKFTVLVFWSAENAQGYAFNGGFAQLP